MDEKGELEHEAATNEASGSAILSEGVNICQAWLKTSFGKGLTRPSFSY
jgi:hypothetical protein